MADELAKTAKFPVTASGPEPAALLMLNVAAITGTAKAPAADSDENLHVEADPGAAKVLREATSARLPDFGNCRRPYRPGASKPRSILDTCTYDPKA
jgi:hypothetical protein